jgi:hypothetical protein
VLKEISTAIEIAKAMDGFEQFGTVRVKHANNNQPPVVVEAASRPPVVVVQQPAVAPATVLGAFKVKSLPYTTPSFANQGLLTRIVPQCSIIDPIQYCQARYGQADPAQLALVRDSFAGEARRLQSLALQTTGKRKRAAGSQGGV